MNTIRNDNTNLYEDILDLKSTIKLNWKSFSEYILSNVKNEENKQTNSEKEKSKKIKELLNSCKRLIDSNISTAQDIRKLKEKISFQNNIIDTLPEKINSEYEEEKKRYLKLQGVIATKKSQLSKLNHELERIRSKAIFKTAKNEIIIAEPNKVNVEMNHEIQTTKSVINKIMEMNKADKEKIAELTNELNELQNAMRVIQNKFYKTTTGTLNSEENKTTQNHTN